jgi:hypothetical protein
VCGCNAFSCWLREFGQTHEGYEKHIREDWGFVLIDGVYCNPEFLGDDAAIQPRP